ncbi:MAG TPA: phenylalanine--tRNA ligase subunit alpha, partial [Elusimicrobiota bacterium]|nr:phenylalanine--tRNA ligase subunit alpha [Elusimicrobiota bacterium]
MGTLNPDGWLLELKHQLKAAQDELESLGRNLENLEGLRVKYLGRQSGQFSGLFQKLRDWSIEDRKRLGPEANEIKDKLVSFFETEQRKLEAAAVTADLAKESIDWTLPAPAAPGRLHPVTETLREMMDILAGMGFLLADGPLVESERYNFEGLNIPADHPARDMQDTFYLAGKDGPSSLLLRTHTSPVQVRYMEANKPPIRIMAPGRVFRHEATDASHSAVFHQVEGLYVDEGVSMADLKATLRQFLRRLLGPKTETRFRPSYFPFTEPSAEVDVRCLLCSGAGCPACKRSGWMEMLGCGLVH